MPNRSDGRGLFRQNDGSYKDANGSVWQYNAQDGCYYQIYDAVAAQTQAENDSAEQKAYRQKVRRWAKEANDNVGGLSFLNPLNWFKGGGSGGGLLEGMFSGFAGGLIEIWIILFCLAMFGILVVEPIWEAINRGIYSIRMFFSNLFDAIMDGFHFIWKHILWFFEAWILTFLDIFRGVPGAGFFGNLIFRIMTIAEIALIVAYLVFLIRKFKSYKRIPEMIKSDIYEPAAIILGFELVKWLLFPSVLAVGFFGMLYNALCLIVWVVIAELIIIAVQRKKYGIW